MKLTPRLLYLIWGDLAASGLFFDNPDAPTEAAFRAHYAAPGAPPVLAWRHRRRDLKYLYDAEINQVQVTPALAPFTRQVEEANARLWRSIPPDLLEVQGDWGPAWFQAAREAHALKLSLILDQGWDVNAHDAQGRTALSYVVVPQEGRRPALQVLVEGGADLSAGGDPMASLLERLWEGVDRNPEDRSWEDRDWLDRTPLGYAGGLTHFLEVLVRERTAAGVGLDGTSPPGLAEASPDPFALRPVKSVELRAGMTYREAQEAVAAVWPALLLEVFRGTGSYYHEGPEHATDCWVQPEEVLQPTPFYSVGHPPPSSFVLYGHASSSVQRDLFYHTFGLEPEISAPYAIPPGELGETLDGKQANVGRFVAAFTRKYGRAPQRNDNFYGLVLEP